MSKVRLLFAPESVGLADRIAAALTSSGLQPAEGEEAAAASLVIWSTAACGSAAILSGARAALARRALVPVALGKAPPPPSFEHLWPMDLSGWDGAVSDPRWKFVLDEIDLAVRRSVDAPALPSLQANSAWPSSAPDAATAHNRGERAFAENAFEDIFEEPQTYVAEVRPRPRIPFAALFAGVAVLGVAAGGALIAGGGAATRSPVEAAPAKPPAPVIAFVQPKDQPADDTYLEEPGFLSAPSAEPPAPESMEDEEVAITGEGDADYPDEGTIESSPLAEHLRDGALSATGVSAPVAAEATEATPLHTSGDELSLSAENTQPDPIAGLAWNATSEGETPAPGKYLRDCVDCPDLAEIEPGVLTPDVTEDEMAPPVMLRKRIAVAVRETTFGEWAACVADGVCTPRPDNGWGKGKRPVINVSWSEARAYARWLAEKTGLAYRLPTETEWEYAARGGSPTAFSFGAAAMAEKANFDATRPYGGPIGAARKRTLPTASFAPNGFGLYDMHGNVAEWTADCWTGDIEGIVVAASGGLCAARVVKGGAWNDGGADLRASSRKGDPETERRSDLGFRVVRDVP
ncbi:MAG: formylglycine-generating enzyme family protein [Pseudomonadota bacterium]